jgi:hypothetical protein
VSYYADCQDAECFYDDCRYAECRGIQKADLMLIDCKGSDFECIQQFDIIQSGKESLQV